MQFPDSLELCRAGYSRNLFSEHHSSEFDSYRRIRRSVRRRGVNDTVSWVCNKQQSDELLTFHRQAGGQYFTVKLPDWQGLNQVTARFDGPLSVQRVRDHYEISATLYILSPPIMPPGDLDNRLLWLIGITDATFNDPIHNFVHNQWPGYWGTRP